MTTTTRGDAPPNVPVSFSDKILNPQAQHFNDRFAFTDFLRKEYRFGLDPNRKTCALFVQGHCPLGNSCPDKHAVSSSYNNLVCKHWLRSLCKKGEQCEFLHEYNLRKMPECNFFVRNGYCSNGEECLYLHIDPDSKIPLCPHYENGFCPLGPTCSKKHVRKQICKFYLAGFCPDGRGCKEGAHPKWVTGLPPPTMKKQRDELEIRDMRDMDREREGGEVGGGRGGFDRGRGGFERKRFWRQRGRDRDRP
ncbi:RNA-binding component of cleavage and polyadenylation factor [Rhizina undulata]